MGRLRRHRRPRRPAPDVRGAPPRTDHSRTRRLTSYRAVASNATSAPRPRNGPRFDPSTNHQSHRDGTTTIGPDDRPWRAAVVRTHRILFVVSTDLPHGGLKLSNGPRKDYDALIE